MRYSVGLRSSRKHHILKRRHPSGIISLSVFLAVLLGLVATTNLAHLDASQLYLGILMSLFRVTSAYVLALVLAVSLAILITANQVIENLLLPIFDVLQSFPSFALLPALVLALQGQPEIVIILILLIEIIWPILFTIIGGMKNRRQDLEEAATIFGAHGWKRFRNFTLPEIWPSVVTGSIVGWGEGWETIIGAELLVSVQRGIGHYLGILGNAHQNTLLAFGIVVLMLALFVINKIVWLPLLAQATKYQMES